MVIQTGKGEAVVLGRPEYLVKWERDEAGAVVVAYVLRYHGGDRVAALRGDYAADLVRRIQAEAKGETTTGAGPMLARCV